MKTDALIASLASGAGPAERVFIGRRLFLAMFAGLILCSAISLGVRGLVPGAMWSGPALWTKLAYATALAAGSAWLLHRLVYPGQRAVLPYRLIAVIGLAMAGIGLVSIARVPAGEQLTYILGKSALVCPWAIPLLSVPVLGAVLHLTKQFAPTDLRRAGLAAGLVAGSIAAIGYALSCKEEAIGFVAIWYSLGILLSAGLGAALGPRLLRW
jgi:hypothetical protein